MDGLLDSLIAQAAERSPSAPALSYGDEALDYAQLAAQVGQAAQGFLALNVASLDRVAVWMEKRTETVVALFGAVAAGCVMVPVNPMLRAAQVRHILRDCQARVLVTTTDRWASLAGCTEGITVVLCDGEWTDFLYAGVGRDPFRRIDSDMAALLYTSGSSGPPKGVALLHRNLVAGARSVARYLDNRADDRLLAVLPLSFDYGLSQLTTAFASGASVVLFNQLLTREIVQMVAAERITGLAAVPSLWIQLASLDWSQAQSLRYLTSSGGPMPRPTTEALRRALPRTKIYLMYGLTEAFRSTYLAPEQLAERPGSIGKAVPNAEVLVLRPDGEPCAPNEPGELVHRGSFVALGYWNDPARTAERFRALPGRPVSETAVWSGDTVRRDEDGYLYFLGRNDDMIKTAGYRVSPTEVEDVIAATGLTGDAAAVGVAHPVLGQVIAVLAAPRQGETLDPTQLMAACRSSLPSYMMPAMIDVRVQGLPRNPNGKIDRRLLSEELAHLFAEPQP